MNYFYRITDAINQELINAGFNVRTFGDYFKVDIARQTIYPYAHVIPTGKTYGSPDDNTLVYSFVIMGLDVVDFNKDDQNDVADPFNGLDNLQDILNDIDNRLSLFVSQFTDGDKYADNIFINASPSQEVIMERFENLLAGWQLSLEISIPDQTPIC